MSNLVQLKQKAKPYEKRYRFNCMNENCYHTVAITELQFLLITDVTMCPACSSTNWRMYDRTTGESVRA